MKVAVILTGALRTIKKTIRYFKENVLLNTDVEVFACIQNDKAEPNEVWEEWIKSEIGPHLKSLEWFNPNNHPYWGQFRDQHLLPNLHIDPALAQYLRTSGSMIEYFQLQCAYIQLITRERDNKFKYQYVIRARTDVIFAKPIDFHWLNWTDNDISIRISKIKQELIDSKIECSDYNIIKYFMNTLISDDLIYNLKNLTGDYIENHNTPLNLDNLNNYIKHGRYILTIRQNLLYIIRRDLFYLIPSIGTFYGYQDFFKSEANNYWWNAECQFQAICYNSNLTIHDYTAEFDEKSLYEYDELRYFDTNFNILNPYMIYCIVRH